jgi:hypothetical protein
LSSFLLEVRPSDENKRVLCPYCGRYVDVGEFYSKHYHRQCLNRVSNNQIND